MRSAWPWQFSVGALRLTTVDICANGNLRWYSGPSPRSCKGRQRVELGRSSSGRIRPILFEKVVVDAERWVSWETSNDGSESS